MIQRQLETRQKRSERARRPLASAMARGRVPHLKICQASFQIFSVFFSTPSPRPRPGDGSGSPLSTTDRSGGSRPVSIGDTAVRLPILVNPRNPSHNPSLDPPFSAPSRAHVWVTISPPGGRRGGGFKTQQAFEAVTARSRSHIERRSRERPGSRAKPANNPSSGCGPWPLWRIVCLRAMAQTVFTAKGKHA